MQLHGGSLNIKNTHTELGLTEEQFKATLLQLQKLNLVAPEGATTATEKSRQLDSAPDYSPAELASTLTDDNTFKSLSDDISRKMGKILSTKDLQILLGIYQWIGLPADVICLLVVFCQNEQIRRFGHGKPPTFRTIEKKAIEWEQLGLVTAELALSWMAEQDTRRSAAVEIARILQIHGRQLLPKERNYIDQWLTWQFTPDIITIAYERTVLRCGRLEWNYIHAILQKWQEQGLTSPEQVEQTDKQVLPRQTTQNTKLTPVNNQRKQAMADSMRSK